MSKIRFIRKGGKIIPILAKKDRSVILHNRDGLGNKKAASVANRGSIVSELRAKRKTSDFTIRDEKTLNLERSIQSQEIKKLIKKIPKKYRGK